MNADVKSEHHEKGSGQINVYRSNDQVWLMKIPKHVADCWMSEPRDSELGSIELTRYKDGRVEVSGIELEHLDSTIPKTCSLSKRQIHYPTFIFSEDHAGNLAMEGHASSQYIMQPNIGDPLLNHCINLPTSKIMSETIIRTLDENPTEDLDSNTRIFNITNTRYVDSRGIADKRVRLLQEELLPLIIAAFRRQERYTLKELNDEVQQPDNHLKEILKDVCNKTRGEKNREYYTLKPEYRMASSP